MDAAFPAEKAQLAAVIGAQEAFTVQLINAANPKFGHYQINNVMPLSKLFKANGLESAPKQISDRILAAVTATKSPMIAKVSAAAIFVNLTLSDQFLINQAVEIFMTGPDLLPKPPAYKQEKIAVDFSSPNVAKSMHVGHLRSTIIGDTVCRLFEYLGCEVLRINHVGDWGTQFGMLIAHLIDLKLDQQEELPITDLVGFYREAKVRFDAEPEFQSRAHQEVVKLQAGGDLELALWRRLCDVSRKEFQRIYDQLGVRLTEVGESFYNPLLKQTVADLVELKLATESQGALIVDVGAAYPLMVRKSDGGYNYDTTDMAAIRYRVHDLNCTRLVYITDLGQQSHFHLVFEAAKRAGWIDNIRVEHCGFGVVVGDDGSKLKTRSGETVKLQDLIDEAIKQAGEQIKENKEAQYTDDEAATIAKAVGISAIKYADLCSNRVKDYRFSYQKMLNFKGNTASYMLYSFARISSIVRKLGIDRAIIYDAEKLKTLEIKADQERNLVFTLLQMEFVMKQTSDDLCPHHLCDWMYQVAGAYTDFYENCRVIGENGEANWTRLVLCEMTRQALKLCFQILGLKEVERM